MVLSFPRRRESRMFRPLLGPCLRGDDIDQMSEFLAMGGYGFYVWGAYGVTALVIVAELVALRARRGATGWTLGSS